MKNKPHLFTMTDKPYLANGVAPDVLENWEYVFDPMPVKGLPKFGTEQDALFGRDHRLAYADDGVTPISWMNSHRLAPGIRDFAYGYDYVNMSEMFLPGDVYQIVFRLNVWSPKVEGQYVGGRKGMPCAINVILDGRSLEVLEVNADYSREVPMESRADLEIKIEYLKRLVLRLRELKAAGGTVPTYPPTNLTRVTNSTG